MKKWLLLMAMLMCCLVGCGRQQALPEKEPEAEEPAKDYVAEYQAGDKKDPINIAWKAGEPENAENYYRQEEYIAPLFEGRSEGSWYGDQVGFGDSYYYYYTEYENTTCKGFYVEHLNLSTLETEKIQYPGDRGGPFGIVYDGKTVYGVFETFNEEGYVDGSVLTELLPDGTFGEDMDIYEVSKEKEILPKDPHFAYQKTVHYCSQKEAIYLIPYDKSALYVIGKDGKLKYEFTGFGEGRATVSLYAFTRDGDAIFIAFDKASRESTYFMYDNGEAKELFSQQGEVDEYNNDMASCDAYGNILYLENRANIVSWNLETGKKERLYCGTMESFRELEFLSRTDEGKLIMILNDIDGRSLSLYSASGPAMQVEIKLETESYYPYNFKAKIQKFERTHPGITFTFGKELENYNDHDMHVSEIYREFIDGNGPDVLIMEPTSLERFVKNDVLMDMSEMIDAEEMCILPGILENGQIEGKQYLFPLSADVRPVLVKKSVWDKPGWTVEEVLDLLEEQEQQGIEDFFFDSSPSGSRYWTLLYFFIKELGDSPFIDPESKTCSFDGDLFRRVLEVCKRYDEIAQNFDGTYKEDSLRIKEFKAGKQLIYYPGMFSFNSFSMLQARLEDDCNWVGYPTESGNGNSLMGGMGIAISNTTENKEILEEFVRCMYSFDYLIDDLTWSVPLRTDILDKTVVEKSDWTDDIIIRLSARSCSPVQGKKKDGTSYKNEYMDFLKSCKSGNNAYGEVISIIQEEAEPYFLNQKSAEEVQKLIQNRVNLYLNEM